MTQLVPFTFDGQQVRVVEIDGESHFVGKDVCDVLGYANPSDAMGNHCRGVAKRYPIPDSLGRLQEARVLTEADMMRLVVNSMLPAAEKFERWVFEDVLPSIRRTGSYQMPIVKVDQSKLVGSLHIAEMCSKLLNMAPSSRIEMLARVAKVYDINPTFLPAYAVDAASDSAAGSSMPTKSLTALLRDHKIRVATPIYNQMLVQLGLLRPMTRASKSSPDGQKMFYSITEKGLRFGKNITSPKNAREVQPHWYCDRFTELHALVDEHRLRQLGEAA